MENSSIFNNPNAGNPIIFSATHPDNQRDFRAAAVSKAERKDMKGKLRTVCTECGIKEKDGTKLLTCSRHLIRKCKNTWYCSKECQVKNWPDHKPDCHKDEHPRNKLIVNVITNTHLLFLLQLALVLLHDINKEPKPDEPLAARCELSIEPSNMMYLPQFVIGEISAEEKEKGTEGMVQVKRIVKLDGRELDQIKLRMWRDEKTRLVEEDSKPDQHVVMLFFYVAGVAQGRCSSIWIPDFAIDRVNSGEGFELKSAISGTMKVPLSIDTCLDGINTHIRSDKHNKLQLRVHLTEDDVKQCIEQIKNQEEDHST